MSHNRDHIINSAIGLPTRFPETVGTKRRECVQKIRLFYSNPAIAETVAARADVDEIGAALKNLTPSNAQFLLDVAHLL